MTATTHLTDESAQRYLEGLLPPPVSDAVKAHVATCASCESLLDVHRALSQELGGLDVPELPSDFGDFEAGVFARIAARERVARRERLLAFGIVALAALTALVAFAAAGRRAWEPVLASIPRAAISTWTALHVLGDVAGPLASALRAPIAGFTAILAIPLLIVLHRMVQARQTATETA